MTLLYFSKHSSPNYYVCNKPQEVWLPVKHAASLTVRCFLKQVSCRVTQHDLQLCQVKMSSSSNLTPSDTWSCCFFAVCKIHSMFDFLCFRCAPLQWHQLLIFGQTAKRNREKAERKHLISHRAASNQHVTSTHPPQNDRELPSVQTPWRHATRLCSRASRKM